MKNRIEIFVLTLSMGLLSQCTPPSAVDRIARNPSVYMAQPKAHQSLIQRGELARGMSRDAVMLAWGRPSESFEGTEKGVNMERWNYLGSRTTYQDNFGMGFGNAWGGPWVGPWGGPFCGGPGMFQSFYYGPQAIRTPYQKATVLFVRDKVESWERMKSANENP